MIDAPSERPHVDFRCADRRTVSRIDPLNLPDGIGHVGQVLDRQSIAKMPGEDRIVIWSERAGLSWRRTDNPNPNSRGVGEQLRRRRLRQPDCVESGLRNGLEWFALIAKDAREEGTPANEQDRPVEFHVVGGWSITASRPRPPGNCGALAGTC